MNRRLPGLLELLSYAGIALVAVLPAAFRSHWVVGDGVDLYGTFWFFWWVGQCISQGMDPSFTDLMFFPMGKDIFGHTGNNLLDALLAQPLVALLPYPDYQPWWVCLLLLGNALSFRVLARQVFSSRWVIWAVVVLWELNPFLLFECMTGRLTQALVWFLPLALAGFLRLGESGRRHWGAAILCGVCTALQAWTYWFMGYFMALAMAWLALLQLCGLARDRARRAEVLRLLAGYGLAALVCLICIAPALLSMMGKASDGTVPGLARSDGVEMSLFRGPPPLANNVSTNLHGYTLLEAGGQPMLGTWVWSVGLALFVLFGRERLRWGGLVVVALAFACGPVVPFGDEGRTVVMPHYMAAYWTLPFFSRLWFPYRLVVIAFVGATLGIGTLLERLERSPRLQKVPRWLIPVFLLGGHALEQNHHLAFPLLQRELKPPDIYEHISEKGGALIELPVGLSRITVAWQPVHGLPTWGGMGENASLLWPDGFAARFDQPFMRFARRLTRDPWRPLDWRREYLDGLVEEGFRWLVLDRQLLDVDLRGRSRTRKLSDEAYDEAPFETVEVLRERVGEPYAVDGALVVWDLVDSD
ncbi:MAG: hypothetical protein QGG40_15395, partial [Myxococcota bacterium]|nr:hypothetical protein [Myxococcota bacterium]